MGFHQNEAIQLLLYSPLTSSVITSTIQEFYTMYIYCIFLYLQAIIYSLKICKRMHVHSKAMQHQTFVDEGILL